jgi:hypothetical protein
MEQPQNRRWEIRSAIVGALAGPIIAGGVAWLTKSDPWLPVICGTFFGAFGGAFGQNIIEGIVIAIMCSAVLFPLIYAPGLPWWLGGIAIGFFAGGSSGFIVHGYFDLRNRR